MAQSETVQPSVAKREAVIRTYLAAMEKGDLAATLACFDPAGIVISPVYGEVAVAPFYDRLFADTASAKVDIHTIYASVGRSDCWAAHFGYQWQRMDGSNVATDLVDLFQFDEHADQIAELKIIFDPSCNKKD